MGHNGFNDTTTLLSLSKHREANRQLLIRKLKEAHYSHIAIEAILARIQVESKFDEKVPNSKNSGAFGLAQWMDVRLLHLVRFYNPSAVQDISDAQCHNTLKHGTLQEREIMKKRLYEGAKNITAEQQVDFLIKELDDPKFEGGYYHRNVGVKIKNIKNLKEAVRLYTQAFEAPGDLEKEIEKTQELASQYAKRYVDDGVDEQGNALFHYDFSADDARCKANASVTEGIPTNQGGSIPSNELPSSHNKGTSSPPLAKPMRAHGAMSLLLCLWERLCNKIVLIILFLIMV